MRVSYDFQAKKGEAYWILLRYRGRKRGIRDSGSKKKFFDGREQNGEAQRKAMKTFRTVAASLRQLGD